MTRIIYTTPEGGVAVIIPAPDCGLTAEQIAAKDVPAGVSYEIVDVSVIPADRTFRNAWEHDGGKIQPNLTKAKAIGHDMRRIKRDEELKPFDDVIAKQIPGKAAADAEAGRQKIRDKYAVVQTQIDAALSPTQIKKALGL